MRILVWTTPVVVAFILAAAISRLTDGRVLSGVAFLGLVIWLGLAWRDNRRRADRTDVPPG
jgi:hypothetical protein